MKIVAKITNIFRYINTTLWSKAGHFNKALSKGAKTTTWIWNLHDYAHDFDIQQRYDIWLKDPKSITPSSHLAYSLIGQDIPTLSS